MIRYGSLFLLAAMLTLAAAESLMSQSRLQNQGIILFEEGDLSGSVDMFNLANDSETLLPESYLMYISANLQLGDAVAGEHYAQEAATLYPDIKAFKWLLAESYLLQDKSDLALPVYESLYHSLKAGETLQPLQVGADQAGVRLGQIYQYRAGRARSDEKPADAIRYMEKAANLMRDSVQVHKNLAVLLLEENRTDELLSHLESARARFPEDSDLIRLQASAYYKLDNREELLQRFEEIHNREPENIDDGLIYSELLIASQKATAGYEVLENLLEHDPRDRRIYELMIRVHEGRFSMNGKRLVLRRMESIFPDDPLISERIAESFEFENQWENARSVYDSLAVVTNDGVTYKLQIANTYEMEGDLLAAENILQKLSETHVDQSLIRKRLGDNLADQQKWVKAAESYASWVALEPDNEEAYVSYGVALYHSGDEEFSINQLLSAKELGSVNPLMYLILSKIYFNINNLAKSFDMAEKAVENSLGELERKQQQIQERLQSEGALARYENRSDADQLDRMNTLATESFEWFINQFDPLKTSPVLDNFLKEYAVSGKLRFMTGAYYHAQGNTERAILLLREAVKFSPKEMEAHFLLGSIYKEEGRLSEAKTAYQRAHSLGSNEEKTYRALIDLYSSTDELDQLCNQWLAAYRASGNNTLLKEHLIEALHKADRFEEANQILQTDGSR